MTTITVRLSEEERRELREHGKISEVVREAVRAYLSNKNSARAIARLKELQRTPIRTGIEADLELLRTDRSR